MSALTFHQALFSKYRPDQERDDKGRFADEGKGGGRGASALLRAGLDQGKFSAAFEAVKKLPKADVIAIARDYKNKPTGSTHRYGFKTKARALAAIRDTFIERHEARDKRNIIDRLSGHGSEGDNLIGRAEDLWAGKDTTPEQLRELLDEVKAASLTKKEAHALARAVGVEFAPSKSGKWAKEMAEVNIFDYMKFLRYERDADRIAARATPW